MGVASKFRPGKLTPQTSDPKLISQPHHPLCCTSIRSRKSRGKLLSCLMEGGVLRECVQHLMQAAEQIQIGLRVAQKESRKSQQHNVTKVCSLCCSAAERSAGDLGGP